MPDIDNHSADVSCCGIGHFSGSEFFIHLGIRHIGFPCLRQRETDIENDEPVLEISLENTVPIGELAIGLAEFDDFSTPEIERLQRMETILQFGTVGTDILYRRRPDRSGNP